MTSPLCIVNGLSTTNGVDVTKNTTVTIQLIDTAGVNTWEIECIGTDDLHTTDDINDTLEIIDITAKTATFDMPDGYGISCIFRSRVNLGVDINGRTVSSYTTTFKVATLINSNRTIAVNEQLESSAAFGWAKPINQIIRASLSSELDLGGDLSGIYPDAVVDAINGTTVTTPGGALIDGYVLTVTGVDTCDWEPITPLVGDVVGTITANTCTLAGDVTGRTGVTVVGKVKGTTITTAGGALATGKVLRVTGVATADWGAVDLTDTDAISGVLPTANRPAPIYAAAAIAAMNPLPTPITKVDLSDGYTNLSNGVTISTANNDFTITVAGAYRLFVDIICNNGGAINDEIIFSFYKNGSVFTTGTSQFAQYISYLPTGLVSFPISFECVASLAVNDVIDVRITNNSLNSPDARRVIGGVVGVTLL